MTLFETSRYFALGSGRNDGVSRDGKRFVMVKNPDAAQGGDTLNVILNWAAALPRAAQ